MLNELRFGKWWAVDYWLVRARNEYDDMQEQFNLFESLFGQQQKDWEKLSTQMRKIMKEQLK